MAAGAIETRGLRELTRAFSKFDKDLVQDMVFELEEAADPARKLSEQIILGGGAGMAGMENMPRTPFYADMRIGVSKGQGLVYVAPAWHRGTGAGTSRPRLAVSFRKRMERAVEDRSKEIEEKMGKWLDTLADDWGRGA